MGDESTTPAYSGMDKYLTEKSWDHLVKRINTVERTENDELMVYFQLCVYIPLPSFGPHVSNRNNGELIRETSTLCAKRIPQKVCSFGSQRTLLAYAHAVSIYTVDQIL